MGMVGSMKTTVDISDALLSEARRVAREDGTTLKALIEEGIRAVLGRRSGTRSFALPDASVGGSGLRLEMRDATWEEIRAAAYGDRL